MTYYLPLLAQRRILAATTKRCTLSRGANHTTSEASDLYVNEVFSRPEFMVLGVGRAYPQGRPQRFGVVIKSHVHPVGLISQRMVFDIPEGIKTMTTTTPTGNSTADALRAILAELTPGTRPYSSDSYLPDHLIDAARTALASHDQTDTAAQQHAHNAMSTAAWHIARGEAPQALARIRRARSHIMSSMEVTA